MRPNLYGLILVFGILAGWFVARKLASRFGIEKEDVDDALPWIAICGILGARLYFVIFSWDYFGGHAGDIFAIWKGGLSIYGAIIGAASGIFLYCWRHRILFLNFLGLAAVAAPLGQAIGRWGNYTNQEAFGSPTNLPWGIYIPPERRPFDFLQYDTFHPTFLYESLWDLLVFFLLLIILRKVHPSLPLPIKGREEKKESSSPLVGEVRRGANGLFTGLYLILYGIGRFFIESIRLDSFFVGDFRVDQIASLLIILAGSGIIIFIARTKNILRKVSQ